MSNVSPPAQDMSDVVQYKQVLAAYDGSKNADRALSRALSIAKEQHASLRIVVVVNTTIPAYSPYVPVLPSSAFDNLLRSGKEILNGAIERCNAVSGDVSGTVEEGHAAEEILRIAAEQQVDLIVMGRRGLSSVERFLMGGVSSAVVNNSKCDVLIVK